MQYKIIYDFDPKKSQWLSIVRQITFEEIITILETQGPLDILEHPNLEQYAHQQLYVVEVKNYIYLVPFVEQGDTIFLKTIYPSRKMTRQYLKREENI